MPSGVAASIIAVVYRVPLLAPVNLLTPNIDNTWHVAQINIAKSVFTRFHSIFALRSLTDDENSLTECMVAISVACLPACVNLFRQSIGETGAWKSLKSAFATKSSKYGSQGKRSGLSDKKEARQGGTLWGPRKPQSHGDTFELIGPEGRLPQTGMYAQPELYSGVAVSIDRGMDAPAHQDRAWITKTVDIYQQKQKTRRSSDSYV